MPQILKRHPQEGKQRKESSTVKNLPLYSVKWRKNGMRLADRTFGIKVKNKEKAVEFPPLSL